MTIVTSTPFWFLNKLKNLWTFSIKYCNHEWGLWHHTAQAICHLEAQFCFYIYSTLFKFCLAITFCMIFQLDSSTAGIRKRLLSLQHISSGVFNSVLFVMVSGLEDIFEIYCLCVKCVLLVMCTINKSICTDFPIFLTMNKKKIPYKSEQRF